MVVPITTQSYAKHWCFTLNNYTDDDIGRLSSLGSVVQYILFAKEVGTVDGTPHLQGFVTFPSKLRFSRVKTILSQRVHLEVARNVPASIKYCKKPDTPSCDIFEFGTPAASKQGKRTDFEQFVQAVEGGLREFKEVRKSFPDLWAKYPRYCKEVIADNFKVSIDHHQLRIWQADLNHQLLLEPSRREVIFIVDTLGDTGKSWFCDYYCDLHSNAQVLMPAKLPDMVYVLEQTVRVVFIDCPRSLDRDKMAYIYMFIENVKNGRVLSTKYESYLKRLNKVHIVVMMNEYPDMHALSADRYNIINLTSAVNRTVLEAEEEARSAVSGV